MTEDYSHTTRPPEDQSSISDRQSYDAAHLNQGGTQKDQRGSHSRNNDDDRASLIASQGHYDDSTTSTLWLAIGLLITVVTVILIAIVIKAYNTKSVLTSSQKHAFNIVITGLILVLALNFFEAFKSLAKSSRRFVLSGISFSWNPEQKKIISGLDSMMNVLKLSASGLKIGTVIICYLWIFLNILAQLSVALISLTYTIDGGVGSKDTYTTNGLVDASSLECYHNLFNDQPKCAIDENSQTLAHAYGDLARSSQCCNYSTIEDVVNSKKGMNECRYYCRMERNNQQFAYRFHEYNPDDISKNYPHLTNRTVTASAGQCQNYSIRFPLKPAVNGVLTYEYYINNATTEGSIDIPLSLGGDDSTTYVYRGIHIPQNATLQQCGPRCMFLWAHRSRGHDQNPQIYKCPITVESVTNVYNDSQSISDPMACLAATSIALSGRSNTDGEHENWNQYQLYTFGSAWESHFREPDQVGAYMAEFAIGSIATMADNNPTIPAPGLVPHLGSHLNVHWNYVLPLLAGIAFVHLLLVLGSMWFNRYDEGRDSVVLRNLRAGA